MLREEKHQQFWGALPRVPELLLRTVSDNGLAGLSFLSQLPALPLRSSRKVKVRLQRHITLQRLLITALR